MKLAVYFKLFARCKKDSDRYALMMNDKLLTSSLLCRCNVAYIMAQFSVHSHSCVVSNKPHKPMNSLISAVTPTSNYRFSSFPNCSVNLSSCCIASNRPLTVSFINGQLQYQRSEVHRNIVLPTHSEYLFDLRLKRLRSRIFVYGIFTPLTKPSGCQLCRLLACTIETPSNQKLNIIFKLYELKEN
jgi:hypothetical protein